MLTFVLCDDDGEDLALLEALLRERYGEHGARLFSFQAPDATLDFLEKRHDVDVVLLDILMPGQKGTELAAELRRMGYRGYILFLTSSNDFAAESYASEAFSYLLKPIRRERFYSVLDKLEAHRSWEDTAGITVQIGRSLRQLLLREIVYLEAQSHMSHFHLWGGEVVSSRRAFAEYASELLTDQRFAPCHSSFLVNMDYIRGLEPLNILLRDGGRIPIAKRYKDFRRAYLKRLMGEEEE